MGCCFLAAIGCNPGTGCALYRAAPGQTRWPWAERPRRATTSQHLNAQSPAQPEDTMAAKTLALIEEHDVKWVDLRFTDTIGKEQHVTIPAGRSTRSSSRTATCSTAPPSPAGRASTSRT